MEFFFPEVAIEVFVDSKRINGEDTKDVGEVKDIEGMFEEVVDETARLPGWETELGGLRGRMREGKELEMVLAKLDDPVVVSMLTAVVSFTC